MRLDLLDDPAAFLDATREHLAADPVLTTVVATVAERMARQLARRPDRYDDLPHHWWAVARDDDGRVAGVAMRTAPFEPHPAYVLPMPHAAALGLARTLHERGEQLDGVNGALPSARVVAEETARLRGRVVSVDEHLRLFELGTVTTPLAPEGRMRAATHADDERCLAWFRDFDRAAAEQVGRTGRHGMGESFTLEDIRARIEDGLVWLWVDDADRPVHLTAATPPANGVSRVGPVYTPQEHRGRGYASAAVAAVSQRIVDAGHRACLFTDQANPTSNKIYEAVGYRPVVDMVNLLVG